MTTLNELLNLEIKDLIAKINPDFKPDKRYNACPFCGSSDAFGVVKRNGKLFKCFSCGEAGNIIKYAAKFWNTDSRDATKRLLGSDYKEMPRAEIRPKKEPQYYSKFFAADLARRVQENQLVKFLSAKTNNPQRLIDVLRDYYVGSWLDGGVVFWQIDQEYRFHRGKIMYYNPDGHRKKEVNKDGKLCGVVSSVRVKLHRSDEIEPEQCYFGQHLITLHPDKTVAIVESEKTAIIASLVMPWFNWIATTSKSLFTAERMSFLKGYHGIMVYPDHDAYEEWTSKVAFLKNAGFNIAVSEKIFKETNAKEDIGDIFLKLI